MVRGLIRERANLLGNGNQKAIAILRVGDPLRCLTASAPGCARLGIPILRCDGRARTGCGSTPAPEQLLGGDAVFGNLFTHRCNDAVQLRESCFFSLLCQRISLRFQFEILSFSKVLPYS